MMNTVTNPVHGVLNAGNFEKTGVVSPAATSDLFKFLSVILLFVSEISVPVAHLSTIFIPVCTAEI